MNSTLVAYNNSCMEMTSEARDAAIRLEVDTNYPMNNAYAFIGANI